MNSEKVKEIKKALECCSNSWDCNSCNRNKEGNNRFQCSENLLRDILTLINELESEDETIRLNMQETEKASFNINQMNGNLVIENQQLKAENERLKKDIKAIHFTYETYNEKYIGQLKDLKKENQQLKDRIAELEKESSKFVKNFEKNYVLDKGQGLRKGCYYTLEAVEYISKARENCKLVDFANRLKEYIEHHHGNYGDLSDSECNYVIDETLKEFLK